MNLNTFKCISKNVSMDDYYELYNTVRENMDHPEWLGVIPREETIEILKNKGKIWLYYDKDMPVCSVFYLPTSNKLLRKHNVEYDESITGSLGPIMVKKEYVGNGLMKEMLKVLEDYSLKLGNKYLFTKAAKDNIYSVNNILKDGYEITHEYEDERGLNLAFIKNIQK